MSQTMHHFFSQVPLFSGLGRAELDEILELVTQVRLSAGHYLFGVGDEGDAAYLIERGTVAVSTWVDDEEVPLARMGPKEVFGELALLDARPRSASVRAVESVLLFRIDGAAFNEMKRGLRPAAAKLTRSIARTVCARLRDTNDQISALVAGVDDLPETATQATPSPLAPRSGAGLTPTQVAVERVSIFERLDARERGLIANHTHLCGLSMGEQLFSEGAPGMSCFILVVGEIGVYKRLRGRDEHLATLGPGALVGHVALIDNARRSATCRVETERAVFLELGRQEFDLLFNANNGFALKILFRVVEDLVDRLRNATARLTEARAAHTVQSARRAAQALVTGQQPNLDITEQDLSRWLEVKPKQD